MRILLVTYDLGNTASGIISYRMVKEMVRQEVETKVLTQFYNKNINSIEIKEVRSSLNYNSIVSRLLRKIGRFLGCTWFEYDVLWFYLCKKELDKIILEWEPDYIYCRSTPADPFFLGQYAKNKYGTKVLYHFTDPNPSPSEYPNKKRITRRLSFKISNIIRQADLVSFGTEEMRKMEEELTNLNLKEKSFISPDVAEHSLIKYSKPIKHSAIRLVYFGSFPKSRNPLPLFQAISYLNSKNTKCELIIYSNRGSIKQIYDGVKFVGRSSNRSQALNDADIFVDLDIEESYGRNVYVSSKLKDYLLYNRPILSIASTDSPTRRLLNGLETIRVVRNNYIDISKAINDMTQDHFTDKDYEERLSVIDTFNPIRVVNELHKKMKETL